MGSGLNWDTMEGLTEGECEDREGFGLAEGDSEGERSYPSGESEAGARGGGGEEGQVGVMREGGGRESPFLWKKLSMLLLRMTDLKDRDRFSRCSLDSCWLGTFVDCALWRSLFCEGSLSFSLISVMFGYKKKRYQGDIAKGKKSMHQQRN